MTRIPESTDPVFRRLVDGGLLYDSVAGCIHHLNETAAVICECWRQPMSEEEIVQVLMERFEVDASVALLHVRSTIGRLRGAGAGE